VTTPRADVVGSLLRPPHLREARQGAREGRVTAEALRAAEDRAVREAIALQEAAGLDVITDGELRRSSWVITIPLREEGAARAPLAGFEFLPADPGWWSLWKEPDGRRARVWTNPTRPFVTRPIEVVRDVVSDEYAFLKAHARARTKFTIPSPSWHRIFWHREYSRGAYPTPEDFLRSIARYLRKTWYRASSRWAATTSSWMRPTTPSGTWIGTTAPPSRRGATTWRRSWWPTRRSTTASSTASAA
jgi:5-methyltetrahydropteroyltriglutamate--homocysteine methyltransferase